MAIAFDFASDPGTWHDNTSGAPLIWPHTCSGDNRLLIVGTVSSDWAQPEFITGVTYDGIPLTLVTYYTSGFGGNRSGVWVLINPPLGTHNIAVTLSNAEYLFGGAVSYSGLKQLSQPNAFGVQTGSHLTIDTFVTSTDANCWGVMFLQAVTGATAWAGVRRVQDSSSPYTIWGFFDTNGSMGPAGAHPFSTTAAGCTVSMHVLLAIGGEAGSPIPVDGSAGCCPEATPTGATGEDPDFPSQAWIRECEGGGAVPIASAPAGGETW